MSADTILKHNKSVQASPPKAVNHLSLIERQSLANVGNTTSATSRKQSFSSTRQKYNDNSKSQSARDAIYNDPDTIFVKKTANNQYVLDSKNVYVNKKNNNYTIMEKDKMKRIYIENELKNKPRGESQETVYTNVNSLVTASDAKSIIDKNIKKSKKSYPGQPMRVSKEKDFFKEVEMEMKSQSKKYTPLKDPDDPRFKGKSSKDYRREMEERDDIKQIRNPKNERTEEFMNDEKPIRQKIAPIFVPNQLNEEENQFETGERIRRSRMQLYADNAEGDKGIIDTNATKSLVNDNQNEIFEKATKSNQRYQLKNDEYEDEPVKSSQEIEFKNEYNEEEPALARKTQKTYNESITNKENPSQVVRRTSNFNKSFREINNEIDEDQNKKSATELNVEDFIPKQRRSLKTEVERGAIHQVEKTVEEQRDYDNEFSDETKIGSRKQRVLEEGDNKNNSSKYTGRKSPIKIFDENININDDNGEINQTKRSRRKPSFRKNKGTTNDDDNFNSEYLNKSFDPSKIRKDTLAFYQKPNFTKHPDYLSPRVNVNENVQYAAPTFIKQQNPIPQITPAVQQPMYIVMPPNPNFNQVPPINQINPQGRLVPINTTYPVVLVNPNGQQTILQPQSIPAQQFPQKISNTQVNYNQQYQNEFESKSQSLSINKPMINDARGASYMQQVKLGVTPPKAGKIFNPNDEFNNKNLIGKRKPIKLDKI